MPARRQSGFNLIELIIFIVVVAIASVGLFAALNQHHLSSVDPIYQVRALELAQSTLDRIIGKRYDEASPNGGYPPCGSGEPGSLPCSGSIGPDAGETAESRYDDLDDYHNFSAVPSSYSGFTLNTQVAVVTLSGQPAKLIQVTVNPPVGEPVQLSAYRANF